MFCLKLLKILFLSFTTIIIPIYSQNNQSENYRLKTVVIDPGHGGKDPGSLGNRTSEKKIVLDIALKLGKYIETSLPDVKVIYTRKTDEFIPLYKRAEIANSNKADLFISIHANGLSKKEAMGTETLVLGEHRAEENFEVAKRENSVIEYEDDFSTRYQGFDPNSPESYIMLTFMQRVYFNHSIYFAQIIQDQFRERTKRIDRGVKQQGLLVLAQTSMPGVLIETGFVTNSNEEEYLLSETGQDYIASAIFRAFRDYKQFIDLHSAPLNAMNIQEDINNSDIFGTDSPSNNFKAESTAVDPDYYNLSYEDIGIGENEVEFKVQITASSKPIPIDSDAFKDLKGVVEYFINERYKYFIGSKRTYNEIIEYSKWVKNRFPDAFIVALKNGKMISMEQALNETIRK